MNCNRLIFMEKVPLEQHIQVKALADIVLDTIAYNGHGTTADALWGALPVVTLAGEHMAARVASSLLNIYGGSAAVTIARNLEDYIDIAVSLGTRPLLLADLKKRLRDARATSQLFDGPRWMVGWERALRLAVDTRHAQIRMHVVYTRPR